MLALVFLETGLLWGAAAAAGPVLIHLMMRTRARRVVFPAVRFVMAGRAAQAGMFRLKHLLILLLRMAALALLAAALAWPSCESTKGTEPAAAVFAFDTSASMRYRVDGVSRLDVARQRAEEIAGSLPPQSRIAILEPGKLDVPPVWLPTPLPDSALASVREGPHSGSMAPLLAQALVALRSRPETRKVVYLFNDRTAHSWRDTVVSEAAGAGINIILVDCAAPDDRGYALHPPKPERDPVTAVEPVAVGVPVRAGADRKSVRVGLSIDGDPGVPAMTEAEFRPLEPGTEGEKTDKPARVDGPGDIRVERFLRTGLAPGIHTGRILLEGDVHQPLDDFAFFNIQVAAPYKAVFVYGVPTGGPAEGRPHVILPEMIEPTERRLRGRHRADVVRRGTSDRWIDDLADAALLVMANTEDLTSPQWDAVDRFVRNGGRLWMFLGDRTTAGHFNAAAARGFLPVRLRERRRFTPPLSLAPTPAHLTVPAFAAFTGKGAGDLGATRVTQCWLVEPRDAEVEAWAGFTLDGKFVPAVLHRKVDRGRVLLWTFNPQRSWSNMQDYVPEWPILIQETLTDLASRGAGRATSYLLGEAVRWRIPERFVGRDVEWGRVGAKETVFTRRFKVEAGGSVDFGIPEEPGNYRVRLPGAGEAPEEAAFSVNPEPDETLATPQPLEWIRSKLPPELREKFRMPQGDELGVQSLSGDEPLAGHLALLLLLIFVLESYFSNRFYKRPDAT